MTTIDGVDIHFIHVRSKHPNALPVIVTHRWLRLDHRAVENHRSADQPDGTWRECIGRRRCDSVIAGPWVFREAHHSRLGPHSHRTRLDRADEAPGLHAICGPRRRDWGNVVTEQMALLAPGIGRHSHQHARHYPRRHCQGAPVRRPATVRPLADEVCVRSARLFLQHGLAYAQEMGNRPQTLYGIEDLPVGLAAWMLDHDARSYALIARVFAGQPEGSRDDILDNVTLYWLMNTAVSSGSSLLESKLAFFAPKGSSYLSP